MRVRDAINRLDMEIEDKLREKNLIGQVKALHSSDNIQIRARSVNFRWHRGIKVHLTEIIGFAFRINLWKIFYFRLDKVNSAKFIRQLTIVRVS